MSQTIVGRNDATVNSERIRYSPQSGWSYAGAIEGPKESVKAYLNQLASLGYSFEYVSDSTPKGSISYDTAGDPGGGNPEQPTTQWEYFANRVEIDILEADIGAQYTGQGNLNAIDDDERRAIRAAIQSPVEGQSPALTSAAAIDLYTLMLGGVRSFRINVPTLRSSKLVSNTYAVQASQTNVGRLITSATLATDESVPTRLFTLPAWVSSKTGFVYAWYKNFPNIQQSGWTKWQISQEWEYGLWPTLTYGNAL